MGGQRRQASNIDMHSVQTVNVCLGAQKFEVWGKCTYENILKNNLKQI